MLLVIGGLVDLAGGAWLGVPCLMLRTTGRKTGQTRTNSLVYAKDGDRYLVVASKGGDAWTVAVAVTGAEAGRRA